jgi:hypothetical protein
MMLLFSMGAEARDLTGYRAETDGDCMREAVDAHVRIQLAKYGPLSRIREYFGFIYLFKGEIASAITRGGSCKNSCGVDTAAAAAQIPPGARPLGEWHTHPHESLAESLSAEDVRGAYNNHHIRCYAAYYSQPDGDIYAWDPQRSLVSQAMSSRYLIGNYATERRVSADRSGSVD